MKYIYILVTALTYIHCFIEYSFFLLFFGNTQVFFGTVSTYHESLKKQGCNDFFWDRFVLNILHYKGWMRDERG